MPRRRNPLLTDAQRWRAIKKQAKKRRKRLHRAMHTWFHPMSFMALVLRMVPEHLFPTASVRSIRRYVEEADAQFYVTQYNGIDDRAIRALPPDIVPDLPRKIRTPAKDLVPRDDYREGDLVQLENGHWVSCVSLCDWWNQGEHRYIFRTRARKILPRASGDWSLMYRKEMKWAFPSVSFNHDFKREEFLVQALRDDSNKLTEVRVYSAKYHPLFRFDMNLPAAFSVPEETKRWWLGVRESIIPAGWIPPATPEQMVAAER